MGTLRGRARAERGREWACGAFRVPLSAVGTWVCWGGLIMGGGGGGDVNETVDDGVGDDRAPGRGQAPEREFFDRSRAPMLSCFGGSSSSPATAPTSSVSTVAASSTGVDVIVMVVVVSVLDVLMMVVVADEVAAVVDAAALSPIGVTFLKISTCGLVVRSVSRTRADEVRATGCDVGGVEDLGRDGMGVILMSGTGSWSGGDGLMMPLACPLVTGISGGSLLATTTSTTDGSLGRSATDGASFDGKSSLVTMGTIVVQPHTSPFSLAAVARSDSCGTDGGGVGTGDDKIGVNDTGGMGVNEMGGMTVTDTGGIGVSEMGGSGVSDTGGNGVNDTGGKGVSDTGGVVVGTVGAAHVTSTDMGTVDTGIDVAGVAERPASSGTLVMTTSWAGGCGVATLADGTHDAFSLVATVFSTVSVVTVVTVGILVVSMVTVVTVTTASTFETGAPFPSDGAGATAWPAVATSTSLTTEGSTVTALPDSGTVSSTVPSVVAVTAVSTCFSVAGVFAVSVGAASSETSIASVDSLS